MFKTVMLLTRRGDIDRAEFVRRYETGHARLGERLLRGRATRYVRRYLSAVPDPAMGAAADPQPDVLMEIWYADRAAWEATMARLSDPATRAEIVADEETLFDRSATRFFLIEEHESQLG